MFKVEGFKIIEQIGEGASSEVFKAIDTNGNFVALKAIRQFLKHNKVSTARLRKEAEHLNKLRDERIVKHLDVQSSNDDRLVLITEYVEGKNVEQLLQLNKKRAQPIVAAALVCQILNGLLEAHQQKIIHRDLKPENILITPQGRIKITDFGIAKDLGHDKLTQTGLILGSPLFMSPEQAMGKQIDQRSDLFSLGVLLYYISTGALPFEGHNYPDIINSLTRGHYPPEKVNKYIHPKLIQIINKSLNTDLNARYQKAYEFSFDLLKFLDELQFSSPQNILQAYYVQNNEEYEIKTSSLFQSIYSSALMAFKENNKELAISHIQHALTIYPNNNDAKELLKKITRPSRGKLAIYLILFSIISYYMIFSFSSSSFTRYQSSKNIFSLHSDDASTESSITSHEANNKNDQKNFSTRPVLKTTKKNTKKTTYGQVVFNIDHDVRVFLNDKEFFGMHRKPLKLKSGSYSLRMVKIGFPPIEGQIDITENNTTTINAKTKK